MQIIKTEARLWRHGLELTITVTISPVQQFTFLMKL
jgi:hypothetical protein